MLIIYNTFNVDIMYNNNSKSFDYKAKSLWSTVTQPALNQANGILKNATIVMPLKYLSNFWQSLEMLLIVF